MGQGEGEKTTLFLFLQEGNILNPVGACHANAMTSYFIKYRKVPKYPRTLLYEAYSLTIGLSRDESHSGPG